MRHSIISLLTDFGSDGSYAGAMKGAILSVHPEALIVDITHEAPAHDIHAAAFLLHTTFRFFPRGTIHVVVVDPGVGGERRGLILATQEHFFIGPDNGVFSYVLEHEEIRTSREISAKHLMRETISPTFHGRDIFGPAAAYLARGTPTEAFGETVENPVRFAIPRPRLTGPRSIRAAVLHVDRFGNVVIGLTREELVKLCAESGAASVSLSRNGIDVTEMRTCYDGAAEGRPFFLFGSSDYLELAANRASAAALTDLAAGHVVDLELKT